MFNGSSYISCGTGLGLNGDFEGTISVWFKASALADQILIVAGKAVAYQSFSLAVRSDGKVLI